MPHRVSSARLLRHGKLIRTFFVISLLLVDAAFLWMQCAKFDVLGGEESGDERPPVCFPRRLCLPLLLVLNRARPTTVVLIAITIYISRFELKYQHANHNKLMYENGTWTLLHTSQSYLPLSATTGEEERVLRPAAFVARPRFHSVGNVRLRGRNRHTLRRTAQSRCFCFLLGSSDSLFCGTHFS